MKNYCSKAEINLDRCLGCGLGVPTCSGTTIDLLPKDEKDRYVPPANVVETFIRIARERGLFKQKESGTC